MPLIIEDDEVDQDRQSPILIENAGIIGSEEDSDKAELEYGVAGFELPEGVYDYVFDSASVGGMTIVSEDGKECTVFENPWNFKKWILFTILSVLPHLPLSTASNRQIL